MSIDIKLSEVIYSFVYSLAILLNVMAVLALITRVAILIGFDI